MKSVKLLFVSAALLLPFCVPAPVSGQPGARVGTESADDDVPAAKPPAGKKKLGAAVPLPGGEPAAEKPEAAKAAAPVRAGEDLEDAGGNRYEKLLIKTKVGSALGSLSYLRSALTIYYADTEGTFPPDLQTLVPKQADSIPALDLPGYSKTNKVVIVKKLQGDDVRKAVRNTGGWLYIADKDSKHWGEVLIDSVKVRKGKPLYEY